MANLTNEFENDILDYLVGRTPAGHSALPVASTTHYLALFTTTLSDATTLATDGTEVSGNNYAREALPGASFGTAAASGSIQNSAELAFNQASGGDWGTIEAWAIVEGNTAGAPVLVYCNDPSIAVTDGDTAKFNANTLTLTAD